MVDSLLIVKGKHVYETLYSLGDDLIEVNDQGQVDQGKAVYSSIHRRLQDISLADLKDKVVVC